MSFATYLALCVLVCSFPSHQGDLEAQKVPSVVRTLAFSVRRVPLVFSSGPAAEGRWVSSAEEPMEVEDDFDGEVVRGMVDARQETLEDSILNAMRISRSR